MVAKVTGKELGFPSGIRPMETAKGAQRYENDPLEYNPALQFPLSIPVYDAMRSQEAHIGSVIQAVTLPIINARWRLTGADTDGGDVRPQVMELVRTELGMPLPGQSRMRRRRQGIVWKNHVAEVAETLVWAGFIPFEQVYEGGPARPDQQAVGLSNIVHLRKLAPRLPRSIEHITVARDGGLVSVEQTDPAGGDKPLSIPVENLLFYVLRKEGADWSGRSILRTAYKSWLIKDVLLRLDSQAAERNSMGIPVIHITSEDQREAAEVQASRLRAGAESHLVLSPEMTAELMGVSGSLIDLTARIKYLDQEMSRSAMAMFLDLGHDGGLGSGLTASTFYKDIFLPSLQGTAEYIAETATEHLIRDLVEHNFGPDEPYPVMVPGDLRSNTDIDSTALAALVNAGLVRPDPALEKHLRAQNNLPAPEELEEGAVRLMPAEEQSLRGAYAQGLIRSGFKPDASLRAAGLDPTIEHLGLLPVTVQPPAPGTNLDVKVPPAPTTPPKFSAAPTAVQQMTTLVDRLARVVANSEDHV